MKNIKEFLQAKYKYVSDQEEVILTIEELAELMKMYTNFKCVETARNVRYRAIEIVQEHVPSDLYDCTKDIMNIPNQEILPEL